MTQSDTPTGYFFATWLDYTMDGATEGNKENVSFKIKRKSSKHESRQSRQYSRQTQMVSPLYSDKK